MINPTPPSTSSIMCLVNFGVTCPSSDDIPVPVADRMKRLDKVRFLIDVESNKVNISRIVA